MTDNDYKMYVIVRNDLPNSLNSGKAMAQVHHAGTKAMMTNLKNPKFQDWINQAQGFGTTIVTTTSLEHINAISKTFIDNVKNSTEIGIIIDPTYPFLIPVELEHAISTDYININNVKTYGLDKYQKNIISTRSEITCCWILVHDETPQIIKTLLEDLPLHP